MPVRDIDPRDMGGTRCRPIDARATGSASSSGRSSRSCALSPCSSHAAAAAGVAAQGRRRAGACDPLHAERARRSARRAIASAGPIERSGYDAASGGAEARTSSTISGSCAFVCGVPTGSSCSRPTTHRRSASRPRTMRVLGSALRGDRRQVVETESFAPDTTTTPEPTALLSTYVPLRDVRQGGRVRRRRDRQRLRSHARTPRRIRGSRCRSRSAIVAVLCLVMTIVSFVWSRRPEEVSGFGPSRRDVRATARDDKKAAAAQAEAAKLRERVKELEGQSEVGRRAAGRAREAPRAASPSSSSGPPEPRRRSAEIERLTARAEAARGAGARAPRRGSSQLQARVTEMEAQLRVTTDQLRLRPEAGGGGAGVDGDAIPPEVQAQLEPRRRSSSVFRAELQAAHAEAERLEKARDGSNRRTRRRLGAAGPAGPGAGAGADGRGGAAALPGRGREERRPPSRRSPPDAAARIHELEAAARSDRSTSARCSARGVPRPSTRPATASWRTSSRDSRDQLRVAEDAGPNRRRGRGRRGSRRDRSAGGADRRRRGASSRGGAPAG